jgi:hypothetical protein
MPEAAAIQEEPHDLRTWTSPVTPDRLPVSPAGSAGVAVGLDIAVGVGVASWAAFFPQPIAAATISITNITESNLNTFEYFIYDPLLTSIVEMI